MATADLTPAEVAAIRRVLDAAFGAGEEAFADDDWDHAIGGTHVVLHDAGDRRSCIRRRS